MACGAGKRPGGYEFLTLKRHLVFTHSADSAALVGKLGMSNTTLGIFLGAVALLFLALLAGNTFIAAGSGLVMLVGVIYAYVVTRRDEERTAANASGGQIPPGV